MMGKENAGRDLAKVSGGVVYAVFKQCFPGVADYLKGKSIEYDLELGAVEYCSRLKKIYNNIRIFDMSKDRTLNEIYVKVNILEKIKKRIRVNIKELEQWEKGVREGNREFERTQTSIDGLRAVIDNPKIIVLGNPGSGKTTFLKYLAIKAVNGEFPEERIPIFITLKNWFDSGKSLLAYIIEQFDICNFEEAGPFIEHILKEGKCILLLDGFDEVTGDVDQAITQIKNFAYKYFDNQYVLSCRVAAWNSTFEHFTDMEMADFDETQIQTFIENWFKADLKKGEKCWEALRKNPPTMELATTPLLLTMLCLAYDETMDFPSNRAELYSDAVLALVQKWDASRGIKRKDVYGKLSKNRKIEMLCTIASNMFKEEKYFFDQERLAKEITSYIIHIPHANEQTIEVDSVEVAKSIESQHGLILERAKDIYSFSHLTFQEYFTAKNIVDREMGEIGTLMDNHFCDPRWREVFILIAGMLPQADDYFYRLREKVSSLANHEIQTILAHAEDTIRASVDYPKPVCKYIALCALNNFPEEFDDLARGLVRACGSTLDFDIDLDRNKNSEFDITHFPHISGR